MSSISTDEAIAEIVKLTQILSGSIVRVMAATKHLAERLPPSERIIVEDELMFASKTLTGYNNHLGELIEKLRARDANE